MNPTDPHKKSLKLRFVNRQLRRPLKLLIALVVGLFVFLAVSLGGLYAVVVSSLPDITKLESYEPAETTRLLASDGTLIATLFEQNRTYAEYDKIAPVMVKAIVAIEDRRFFEHKGVDPKGIARAVVGNLGAGRVQQGASTLTMQLARRLFLSDERTYTRKLREAVLAYRIDTQLSKEKILELYLNEVYFGSGAYGIDSAASLYFKKNPDQLELWEAATLAGLVQAPTELSPLVDRRAALKRLNEVLDAMQQAGDITAEQSLEARKTAVAYKFVPRPISQADGLLKYPYFSTYVIGQLAEQFPEKYVRRGGLQVVTSLNVKLQKVAETALSEALAGPGRAAGADAGAVVVIDNATGQLVAMAGGPGWNNDKQFNAAWQAHRQPGSAFKMFIYAAALEAGFTPEHEFPDTKAIFSPGTREQWEPRNSDNSFMGAIPLRTGLQLSRNLVSAKVLAHLRPRRVINLAHKMGIETELPEYASLALGAGEVTPLQMTRAFSALPAGGVLRSTLAIKSISHQETILADFSERQESERVLSRETATTMCEILRRVVTGGTATGANIEGTFVAGKTGTTDNHKDAWFVGFTPHHTIGVWIGRDDNKPMAGVYGGTIPADIFYRVAKAGLEGKNAEAPLFGVSFEEQVSVKLCYDSTYLATPYCQRSYNDAFGRSAKPTRWCPTHRQVQLPPQLLTVDDDQVLGSLSRLQAQRPIAIDLTKLPDDLNPRKDPEVVTPTGAAIPYAEEAPSLKTVRFVLTRRPSIEASPTPSLEPFEQASPNPNHAVEEPWPFELEPSQMPLSGAPSPEHDPAFSVHRSSRATSSADDVASAPTLDSEPSYPTAEPERSLQEEVLYEPSVEVPSTAAPTIPTDPISPE